MLASQILKHAAHRAVVSSGLEGVGIVDTLGRTLAVAGALDADEARAIAASALRDRSPAGRASLMNPEVMVGLLEPDRPDRRVHIGIAAHRLFFIAVFPRCRSATSPTAIHELRATLEGIPPDALWDDLPSPAPGSGGSSSGPADLPLIEFGITVPRGRN